MKTSVRMGIVAITFAAVLGLIAFAGSTNGQGKKGGLHDAVKDIGEEIRKGNKDAAKKLAANTAKNLEDTETLMKLFKLRKQKGLGAGPIALSSEGNDGIEKMIRDLAKEVPGGIAKQSASLETMGYWISAMGEMSHAAHSKVDFGGKKSKAKWLEWSDEMRELGVVFAKAAATKKPAEIKAAAARVNANCNECHSIFRQN